MHAILRPGIARPRHYRLRHYHAIINTDYSCEVSQRRRQRSNNSDSSEVAEITLVPEYPIHIRRLNLI